MILELTDGEHDRATTDLQNGLDFNVVVNDLIGQFSIALQMWLQDNDFRVCNRCGQWDYTWRFGENGEVDDSDEKAYGEWVCYEDMSSAEREAISRWLIS